MWYLGVAVAAGYAIALKRKNKQAELEKERKLEKESTDYADAANSVIEAIAEKCWRTSIKKGRIPPAESDSMMELYKYEFLPAIGHKIEYNNPSTRAKICGRLYNLIKKIDSKHQETIRGPIIEKTMTEIKKVILGMPGGLEKAARYCCESLNTTYHVENASVVALALTKGFLGLTAGKPVEALELSQEDKIFEGLIKEEIKNLINKLEQDAESSFALFLDNNYPHNSGAYESRLIARSEESKSTAEWTTFYAAAAIIESEELWNDYTTYANKSDSRNFIDIRSLISWNNLAKISAKNAVEKRLEREGCKASDEIISHYENHYLKRFASTYSWSKLKNGNRARDILLIQIADQLERDEFTGHLSAEHAIRISWDKALFRTITRRLCDITISKHSIAYAEEDKLAASLSGPEYEQLCGQILRDTGWRISYTKGSNDQGADIIAKLGSITACIQCKRRSSTVGNSAVQEAFASKTFYKATHAIVVSNSTYTKSAMELAQRTNVSLLHTKDLYSLHFRLA